MKFDKVNSNRTSLLPFRGRTSSLTQADIFDEVYRKTYLSVYRYIYGLSAGSRQQAEDLTAETYLRAWKNRNSYQGKPDAAIAWLLRIARNLTIDSHRQCKARPELNANPLDEELNLSASAGANPEIRLIASEQQHHMLALLTKLPLEQREIIVLRYLLNWKIQHIAQYLDFPENTVSVYLRRALERLKLLWQIDKE